MRRAPGGVLLLLLAALWLAACTSSSPVDPGPPRELTYVALGASDAVGVGAFPLTDGYVFLIRDRMTERGFTVGLHNLGISGAKLDQIAREALPEAVGAAPDVVTLWAGPNDLIGGRSPETFAAQLDAVLADLKARGTAQVFVGDIPDLTLAPLFVFDPDPDVTRARITAFNVRLHEVVAARGAILVRLSDIAPRPELFSIDGFHPSDEGHRRIAEAYWNEISPRL